MDKQMSIQGIASASLLDLFPNSGKQMLTTSGPALIQRLGEDAVRDVVLDVFLGGNLRDSTEQLTRARIATINLALLEMYLKGVAGDPNFHTTVENAAIARLGAKGVSKPERWLAEWLIGLTDKATQNVLRDSDAGLKSYVAKYQEVNSAVVSAQIASAGELEGVLELDGAGVGTVNWEWFSHLLNAIGAETLTIRGSEKSTYGKLFERLILGSLLVALGYEYNSGGESALRPGQFILSSAGEKRESDATLLYDLGRAARFDIGFIGRGNTEISLDKVSRFEAVEYINGKRVYVATVIIVDRIGARSRIESMAKDIGGSIVQMSAAMWPVQVDDILANSFGYAPTLKSMSVNGLRSYMGSKLLQVPITSFLPTN